MNSLAMQILILSIVGSPITRVTKIRIMADFTGLKETVDDLTKWYWSYGRLRKGRHAIERSDWLNRLYETKRSAESLGLARISHKRA